MDIHLNSYYNYLKNLKAGYRKDRKQILLEITKICHDLNGVVGFHISVFKIERFATIVLSSTSSIGELFPA